MSWLSKGIREAEAYFRALGAGFEQAAESARKAGDDAEAAVATVVDDVVSYGLAKVRVAEHDAATVDSFLDEVIAAFTAHKSAGAIPASSQALGEQPQ